VRARLLHHTRPSDIRGYGRLAIEATLGITNLVEAQHHNILRAPGIFGTPAEGPTRGVTGLVYGSIRGVTRLVGGGLEAALTRLEPLFEPVPPSSGAREAVLAALNGVLGDHLAESDSPLTIPMRLRRNGLPLELTREALRASLPRPTGRILLLAHGLCRNDVQWRRRGHDHGAALAADAGFTPVYLHYNSGLSVPTNGRACAALIEELLRVWPVPVDELVLIGHSMGGLVYRSACHYGRLAGHSWLRHLSKIVFLGTPHHGAPLERGGNRLNVALGVSPYTAAFARLGRIRSAGITDLRYGGIVEEGSKARDRFARARDTRPAVPLPAGVSCYAMAASIGEAPRARRVPPRGDGLVPVDSALGRHADRRLGLNLPEAHEWVGFGMNHLDLLDREDAYEQIVRWVA